MFFKSFERRIFFVVIFFYKYVFGFSSFFRIFFFGEVAGGFRRLYRKFIILRKILVV